MKLSDTCRKQLEEAETRVEIADEARGRCACRTAPFEQSMTLAEYMARAAEGCRGGARPLGAGARARIPPTIHRAMRYSLFAGGKRIRPLLAIAAAAVSAADAPSGIESCGLRAGDDPHLLADPR